MPGANYGATYAVFETAAWQSGRNIADKNMANPTGMLLVGCVMLDYLKLHPHSYCSLGLFGEQRCLYSSNQRPGYHIRCHEQYHQLISTVSSMVSVLEAELSPKVLSSHPLPHSTPSETPYHLGQCGLQNKLAFASTQKRQRSEKSGLFLLNQKSINVACLNLPNLQCCAHILRNSSLF